jgi:hypothetical protein
MPKAKEKKEIKKVKAKKINSKESDFDSYLLDFFRDYFYSERELKYKLYNRMSLILTALSIIFVGYLKIYTPIPTQGNCSILTLFYICTLCNIIFLGIIAFYFVKIMKIKKYIIPASPQKWYSHIADLRKHHAKDQLCNNIIEKSFKNGLADNFKKSADDWYNKNISFANYSHETIKWLFILFISTFFTLCCYCINESFFINPSKQEIKLCPPEENKSTPASKIYKSSLSIPVTINYNKNEDKTMPDEETAPRPPETGEIRGTAGEDPAPPPPETGEIKGTTEDLETK